LGISSEERKLKLARILAVETSNGWKVESQTEFTAVLYFGKGGKINHILHLLLSCITIGLWLIVWTIIGLTTQRKTKVITIDENGEAIIDFGTNKKFIQTEGSRIRYPIYKKKTFWIVIAFIVLAIVSSIGSKFDEVLSSPDVKPAVEKKQETVERKLTVYDIQDSGGYDSDADEFFWGASFKVKYVPLNTKILCTTDGVDSAGKNVQSQTDTYNVLPSGTGEAGSGQAILFGSDGLPSISKEKFKRIKKLEVNCLYFD
jgi:hypothetical protein